MAGPATFRSLRVSEIRPETDDSVVVTLDVPDDLAAEFAFRPGQHLTVRRGTGEAELRRSYSICSPSGGPLRIGVRHLPDGRVSGWINRELRAGDHLDVLPPAGSFVVDDSDAPRHHVAVAAGSGITPVSGIVASVLADEPGSMVTLLTINRSASSAMLLEELQALKDRWPDRLRLLFALTREQTEIELLSGRPDRDRLAELVSAGLLPADADRYWLCGPEELIGEVTDVLADHGVPGERIRRELFGTTVATSRRPDAGVDAEATVTLGGRTTVVPVRTGEALLDAVRRQRPEVPFSCTAGVCATCRAHLVDGTVDPGTVHGLRDEEIEQGFVLTCQARPTSSAVTVDYDA
ncbi:MAG: 2Fe-2S iron-sulfur cluster-binding protein [Actinomycetota bacterium]